MTEAHELEFTVEDEGHTYGWKITYCPGNEHGCRTYEETTCTCVCEACTNGDHWECEKYLSTGLSCSLQLMDTCGLEDWLSASGSELIHGRATVKVKAKHYWTGDYPVLELQ